MTTTWEWYRLSVELAVDVMVEHHYRPIGLFDGEEEVVLTTKDTVVQWAIDVEECRIDFQNDHGSVIRLMFFGDNGQDALTDASYKPIDSELVDTIMGLIYDRLEEYA